VYRAYKGGYPLNKIHEVIRLVCYMQISTSKWLTSY